MNSGTRSEFISIAKYGQFLAHNWQCEHLLGSTCGILCSYVTTFFNWVLITSWTELNPYFSSSFGKSAMIFAYSSFPLNIGADSIPTAEAPANKNSITSLAEATPPTPITVNDGSACLIV